MAIAVPRTSRFVRGEQDDRLVARSAAASSTPSRPLYDRYAAVLSFCRHMLGDLQEAEDAVQHTFLSAHRALLADERDIHLKAWLFAIARNRCLSVLRARRDHVGSTTSSRPARPPACPPRLSAARTSARCSTTSRGSPMTSARPSCSSELRAHSHDEIAEVLGVKREKVKALVFQAREGLSAARIARETPCEDIREELATARGGALRRGNLRRHLEVCAGCRAFRDEVPPARRARGRSCRSSRASRSSRRSSAARRRSPRPAAARGRRRRARRRRRRRRQGRRGEADGGRRRRRRRHRRRPRRRQRGQARQRRPAAVAQARAAARGEPAAAHGEPRRRRRRCRPAPPRRRRPPPSRARHACRPRRTGPPRPRQRGAAPTGSFASAGGGARPPPRRPPSSRRRAPRPRPATAAARRAGRRRRPRRRGWRPGQEAQDGEKVKADKGLAVRARQARRARAAPAAPARRPARPAQARRQAPAARAAAQASTAPAVGKRPPGSRQARERPGKPRKADKHRLRAIRGASTGPAARGPPLGSDTPSAVAGGRRTWPSSPAS